MRGCSNCVSLLIAVVAFWCLPIECGLMIDVAVRCVFVVRCCLLCDVVVGAVVCCGCCGCLLLMLLLASVTVVDRSFLLVCSLCRFVVVCRLALLSFVVVGEWLCVVAVVCCLMLLVFACL